MANAATRLWLKLFDRFGPEPVVPAERPLQKANRSALESTRSAKFEPAPVVLEIDGAWVSGHIGGIPMRHVSRELAETYRANYRPDERFVPVDEARDRFEREIDEAVNAIRDSGSVNVYQAFADGLAKGDRHHEGEARRAGMNPNMGAPYGSPFARQVGGDHYRTTRMQPFQFTGPNGWDGAAHTILKYVARFEDKGGRADLEKALHVVDIRVDLLPPGPIDRLLRTVPVFWGEKRIKADTYCEVNGYTGLKRGAILALEGWVLHPTGEDNARICREAIAELLAFAYPS